MVQVSMSRGELIDRIAERQRGREAIGRSDWRDWLASSPEMDELYTAMRRLHEERARIEESLRLESTPDEQRVQLSRDLRRCDAERDALIERINAASGERVGGEPGMGAIRSATGANHA